MYKVLESGREFLKVIGYMWKIQEKSLEFFDLRTKFENPIDESTKTRTSSTQRLYTVSTQQVSTQKTIKDDSGEFMF